ncbi:hypothetical protein DL93DRAFT_2070887 [Clavulina sp. PMI_390]|nr:hypothetical protein DL93DRAFT_2070887 [Clavulina sp. PMI_390]
MLDFLASKSPNTAATPPPALSVPALLKQLDQEHSKVDIGLAKLRDRAQEAGIRRRQMLEKYSGYLQELRSSDKPS